YDQLHVPAPSQCAVTFKAADGGKIVWFLTEAVLVKTRNRRIHHLRRIEAIKGRPTWFRDPCRLVFEERLVGRNFAGLSRQIFSFKSLQGLPAKPTKLVVVPHVDERPAGSGVLQVRIAQIRTINCAIVFHSRRNVKVPDLLAVRIADDVPQAAVVDALRTVLWVPDNLIDEVAEVQHEVNPLRFGSSCVL